MTNSNAKGDRRERELVRWASENGWVPIRVPASGSATTRDLPDVLLGNTERFIAAEVKASAESPIYLDGEEIDALERFAEAFGAQPRVAVKFDLEHGDDAYGKDRPGFYFVDTRDLTETDGGNYRIRRPKARVLGEKEVDL